MKAQKHTHTQLELEREVAYLELELTRACGSWAGIVHERLERARADLQAHLAQIEAVEVSLKERLDT